MHAYLAAPCSIQGSAAHPLMRNWEAATSERLKSLDSRLSWRPCGRLGRAREGMGGDVTRPVQPVGHRFPSMPGDADPSGWTSAAWPAHLLQHKPASPQQAALLCPGTLLSAPHLVLVPHELHAVLHVAQQHKVLHHIQAGQQHGAVIKGCGAAGRGQGVLIVRAACTARSMQGVTSSTRTMCTQRPMSQSRQGALRQGASPER